MDVDDDPIGQALTSRRIPHQRSRNKQKGRGGAGSNGGGTSFNPLRALGHYEVHLGSSSRRSNRRGHGEDTDPSAAWLEIHELTPGDDGLIGTFHLEDARKPGTVSGICVLAGSRKALQAIVSSLEKDRNDDDNDDDEDEGNENDEDDSKDEDKTSKDEAQDTDAVEIVARRDHHNDDHDKLDENNENSSDSSSDPDEQSPSTTTTITNSSSSSLRARAFEKNTFRSPKFWIRWKGHVKSDKNNNNSGSDVTETNQGYLIFATNDCARFDGTVTCAALGWDNVKIRGWKMRPGTAKGKKGKYSLVWNDC